MEPRKILVVDDEIKILEVVQSFLESKGFSVCCAENGQQALAVFERERVSLILLDLMLPDMSGERLCAAIRRTSRVPVIMLTAKIEEEDMLRGLWIGADDYITKPFSLKALHARIEAVLRRCETDPAPRNSKRSFHDGDLTIDFESHTVHKRRTPVSVTPKEFNILAALTKHPGRVYTREELIRAAFDEDFEGFDRAVDSHIKNLRQKIEDNPKHPVYLLTLHGVGYKFGGEPPEKA